MTIEEFAAVLLEQQKTHHLKAYGQRSADNTDVKIVPGKKYVKVDRVNYGQQSGAFMIVPETGEIFGIKGYGVIHRGHAYGTLDTVDDWYWGDYYPEKRKG